MPVGLRVIEAFAEAFDTVDQTVFLGMRRQETVQAWQDGAPNRQGKKAGQVLGLVLAVAALFGLRYLSTRVKTVEPEGL